MRVLAIAMLLVPFAAAAGERCSDVPTVPGTSLRTITVIDELPASPTALASPPGDLDRLFVALKSGTVRIWRSGDPSSVHAPFLDIAADVSPFGEQGLLGLAFDPGYARNRHFYVNYTDRDGDTVVSRFTASAGDPDVADRDSELVMLRIDQPESNHNGGDLAFGPDGSLYISTGDGGGGGDFHGACGNGQNTANLHGAILRIDPGGEGRVPPDCGLAGYSIPADNPFVRQPGEDCDEIVAYGLRNPWRFDIDPVGGHLYIGDVGQSCYEEIDYVVRSGIPGANFGWRQMEGAQCFERFDPFNCDPAPSNCGSSPRCGDPSLALPIHEYGRDVGGSVIGGKVYRGCRMPELDGSYFFGDFSGRIWSFRVVYGERSEFAERTEEIGRDGAALFSFGRDARGELYLLDGFPAAVRKIVPELDRSGAAGR